MVDDELSAELLTDIGTAVKNVITSLCPGASVEVNVVRRPRLGLWVELKSEIYPRFITLGKKDVQPLRAAGGIR